MMIMIIYYRGPTLSAKNQQNPKQESQKETREKTYRVSTKKNKRNSEVGERKRERVSMEE